MNELLQKHGCANVFNVPEGLRELMSDITREVLRWQPAKLLDFIANYLSALLITREHGIMAVKILDELCDCKPSVSEHLLQLGLDHSQAGVLAGIIKGEIESHEPVDGKEKVKEAAILKKVLNRYPLDENMSAQVCQVARNAYRDYWYRRTMLQKGLHLEPTEAWQKAAEHTLEIYKKTKPSISELHRAAEKIQAAYRGYHVRRNVLRHLAPQERKMKKLRHKVEIPGPPLDIAGSREIDLGPVVSIKTQADDVNALFDAEAGDKLGLWYDPMKTIGHKEDDDFLEKKGINIQIGGKEPKFAVMRTTVSKSAPIPTDAILLALKSDKTRIIDDPAEDYSPFQQRISFAQTSPEVIIDEQLADECEVEIPEVIVDSQALETIVMPPAAFEIPEEVSDVGTSGPQSALSSDIEDDDVIPDDEIADEEREQL